MWDRIRSLCCVCIICRWVWFYGDGCLMGCCSVYIVLVFGILCILGKV